MSEGRAERRLAAILAMDVAGYSRLMGTDEEGTLAAHEGAGAAARQGGVRLDDSDPAAHTVLANYEMFSGRHEEARRRLRRAADLDPNGAFALNRPFDRAGDQERFLTGLRRAGLPE
jgi:hypothetical protein